MQDHIERRREAILHPTNPYEDENIGGGQGSRVGNPVEAICMKIVDDEQVSIYTKHMTAIESSLNKIEPPLRAIIKKRYFEQLKQEEVSKELAVTIATIQIVEDLYFRTLARRLKLMI